MLNYMSCCSAGALLFFLQISMNVWFTPICVLTADVETRSVASFVPVTKDTHWIVTKLIVQVIKNVGHF